MSTGTVKFFNEEKGFGFIKPDEGSKDLFVHKNNVNGSITDNDKVKYDTEDTAKGPAAINVSVISESNKEQPMDEGYESEEE